MLAKIRDSVIGIGFTWIALSGSGAAAAGTLGLAAPDQWAPHESVGVLSRVTLQIHWLGSVAELREAASGRDLSPRDLRGFSILKRNKTTGEYHCEVFIVRMQGALVDKDRTVTFGHEVLHCFGLGHE